MAKNIRKKVASAKSGKLAPILKDLPAKNAGRLVGGLKPPPPPPKKGCWVARAVYGESDPRWLLLRAWLMSDAPKWFRALYLRHGERVARIIAPHPIIRSLIRAWMDWVIEPKHASTAFKPVSTE